MLQLLDHLQALQLDWCASAKRARSLIRLEKEHKMVNQNYQELVKQVRAAP